MKRYGKRAFKTGKKKSKDPEMEMSLICAKGRRPTWQNVIKYKTMVGDDVREAGRARMSGDENKKKE